MKIYRLPTYTDEGERIPNPDGNWVITTTWFGGLVHVDDVSFWKAVKKFIRCSRHHISETHRWA